MGYTLARDAADGQYYARLHSSREWVPVDERQVETLREGDFEAFAGSLINSVGRLALGTAQLLGDHQTDAAIAPEQRRLEGQEQLRGASNPVASFAGAAVPYVGIGAATGGMGLPAMMATEGFLGAATTPDRPLMGAAVGAVGGGVGYGLTSPLMVRQFQNTAQQVVNQARRGRAALEKRIGRPGADSVGAARNVDPEYATTQRALEGYLSPEELAEEAEALGLGRVTTRGDELALTARAGTDELNAAETVRQAEELRRTNVLTDRTAGGRASINAIRDEGANLATRAVLRELGEPIAERLTDTVMRGIRDRMARTFDDVAEEAGDLQFTEVDLRDLDEGVLRASADDERLARSLVENIKDDIRNGALAKDKAQQYRTRLNNEIQRASNAGLFSRVITMHDLQDVLDDIVERQISNATSADLAEARYQYRVFKALERSYATTDASGQVNLRSFKNAMERGGNRFNARMAKGERGARFARLIETALWLTQRVEPSSGTAQRVLNQLANKVPLTSR